MNYEQAGLMAATIAATVAAVRARWKSLDGPWVLLVAFVIAAALAGLQYAPNWIDAIKVGGLAWVLAIGGTALLKTAKSPTFPADEPITKAETPLAKRMVDLSNDSTESLTQ